MFTNRNPINTTVINGLGIDLRTGSGTATIIVSTSCSAYKYGYGSGTAVIVVNTSGSIKIHSVDSAEGEIIVTSSGTGSKISCSPPAISVVYVNTSASCNSYKSSGAEGIVILETNGLGYKIHSDGGIETITVSVSSGNFLITNVVGAKGVILVETSGQGKTAYEYENVEPESTVVGLSEFPVRYECSAFYVFDFTLSMYNPVSGEYYPIDFEISEAYIETWENDQAFKRYDCEIYEKQTGMNAPKYPGIYYLVVVLKSNAIRRLTRIKIRTGLAVKEG